MENLFKLKNLEKIKLEYKNAPFYKEYIDAFYIYEYIIKQILPELIYQKYKDEIANKKQNIHLYILNYAESHLNNKQPVVLVQWEKFFCGAKLSLFNSNSEQRINNRTFESLLNMFKNFINFYSLGFSLPASNLNEEFLITAPLYQVIDAFYSEWQRIDYETKEIIEDYQKEYGIDKKILFPGENIPKTPKRKIK